MRTTQNTCCIKTGRWRLTAAAVTLLLGLAAPAADLQLPLLRTKTGTFTNVTVFKLSKTDVFFTHSRGIANIKTSSLDSNTLQRLESNEVPDPPPVVAGTKGEPTKVEAPTLAATTTKTVPAPDTALLMRQKIASSQMLLAALSSFRPGLSIVAALLAVFLGLYLFLCYCFKRICEKAGDTPGILVWIPGLQMFPLLRAAGMSGWWFLAFLVPILNLVAQIVWSIKIVQARGKGVWVTLMLILPITNLFALLYLAFSSGNDDSKEVLVNIHPPAAALGEA